MPIGNEKYEHYKIVNNVAKEAVIFSIKSVIIREEDENILDGFKSHQELNS
jgi:hypothetical protein